MKNEHKKKQNIVTAFDNELDESYELPHGWKYSKMLKLFERELYYKRMSNWCESAIENNEIPASLLDVIEGNEYE